MYNVMSSLWSQTHTCILHTNICCTWALSASHVSGDSSSSRSTCRRQNAPDLTTFLVTIEIKACRFLNRLSLTSKFPLISYQALWWQEQNIAGISWNLDCALSKSSDTFSCMSFVWRRHLDAATKEMYRYRTVLIPEGEFSVCRPYATPRHVISKCQCANEHTLDPIRHRTDVWDFISFHWEELNWTKLN